MVIFGGENGISRLRRMLVTLVSGTNIQKMSPTSTNRQQLEVTNISVTGFWSDAV